MKRLLALLSLALVVNAHAGLSVTTTATPAGATSAVTVTLRMSQGSYSAGGTVGWQYSVVGVASSGATSVNGDFRFYDNGALINQGTSASPSFPQWAGAPFTATFAAGHTVTLTVETHKGAAYAGLTSTTFVVPPVPPAKKKQMVSLEPVPYDVTYKTYKQVGGVASGNPISTITVPAGQPALLSVASNNGADLIIMATSENIALSLDTGEYVPSPTGAPHTWIASDLPNAGMTTDAGTTTFVPNTTPGNQPGTDPTMPPNAGGTGVTGAPGGTTVAGTRQIFNGTDTASTTALNAGVFAAGINGLAATTATGMANIVAAVKAGPSGAGGTGTDMSGVESRLDTSNVQTKVLSDAKTAEIADLAAKTTAVNALGTSMGTAVAGGVTGGTGSANSTAAGISGTGLFTGSATLAGTNPMPADNGYALTPHTVSTADNPILAGIAGGGSLDVNPFTSAAMQLTGAGSFVQFCTWIKYFITWALIVAFLGFVFKEVLGACRSVGTTPMGMPMPGSTQILLQTSVLGNSIGVPPAVGLYLIQVVAMTTLILASPALIVAAFTLSGSASTLIITGTAAGVSSGTGLGTLVMNVLSYAYVVLPVALMITITVNGLLVRMSAIVQWVISVVLLKILAI